VSDCTCSAAETLPPGHEVRFIVDDRYVGTQVVEIATHPARRKYFHLKHWARFEAIIAEAYTQNKARALRAKSGFTTGILPITVVLWRNSIIAVADRAGRFQRTFKGKKR
jgi:hypothetical protein